MKKQLLTIFAGLGMIMGANAQVESLIDNSLELTGAGGTQWTSTSTNFGTVLCDVATCGTCGGPCAPRTGTYYAWFGGTSNAELGTLSQTFTVATTGGASLSFYLMVPNAGAAGVDSFGVVLDGNVIYSKDGADTVGYDAAYAVVNVPLGSLTAGPHTINFAALTSGTSGGTYNVLVDDISVMVGGSAGTETIILDEHIRMFHNTAEGNLYMNFDFPEASDLNVSIIDMNGKIVMVKSYDKIQNESLSLSTAGLSSGVYSVYFAIGNNASVAKKVYISK